MSRSYDLFSEGPRKRNPRVLGLDELNGRSPGWDGGLRAAFDFVFSQSFCCDVAHWTSLWPVYCDCWGSAPQSTQTISRAAIKVAGRIALSPTCLFDIAALRL
jgi:hypothetical protein